MIPAINDGELEAILSAAAQAGASSASMIVLRLPLEVRDLFVEWLAEHFPLRAEHAMSLIRQMRGGADYDSTFGLRMRGAGEYASLLHQRFTVVRRRLGLERQAASATTALFRMPTVQPQGELFAPDGVRAD